jgi:hypothetical protein
MKHASLLLLVAVLGFVLAGCSDDDNPAGPGAGSGSTSYVGVIAGTGVTGSLTIVVPNPKASPPAANADGDTVQITATLKINGGSTIPLTGFIVISTGELYLAGGGYVFTGTVDGDTIAGTFTYPGGGGIFNCEEGNSANVKTYCGTYHATPPGTDSGYFNLTVEGNAIVVIVFPDDAGGQSFMTTGTINAENQISIVSPENSSLVIATGTLNPETGMVSGTYLGDPGGTWAGEPCN